MNLSISRLRLTAAVIASVAGSLASTDAFGKAPSSALNDAAVGVDWVRCQFDDNGEALAMQTAIARYRGQHPLTGKPLTVDLIGAVHIGDKAYYTDLNRRFAAYDALLYELVAPEGTVVQPGTQASARNPLGAMQSGAKNLLELEHQLEQIDYTARNFIHADMSPDEFFQSMEDRNEGILQMYLRMTGQAIAMQGSGQGPQAGGDLELLFALFAKDRSRRLKVAMAKQLAQSESLLSAFGGEEGSTLITERNKVALEVLEREIAAGRDRIGVFYGAGHLADMDERLRRDFKLAPVGVEWLTAWDLRPAGRSR